MEAIGTINWWGSSPSFDMQDIIKTDAEEINLLIIGAGDGRHVLNTIASSYLHSSKKINFYIIEGRLELYARQMLLLKIIFNDPTIMGAQDKTEYFLEIFGNSLIREQTMDLVKNEAYEFIKMITDFDYLVKVTPYYDFSNLKYKERDFLEGIFKFWRNEIPKNLFDIINSWDKRLRVHLKGRYDAIPNVFDWDYSMKLCDKDAGVIGIHSYKRWRRNGVAFELRDTNYGTPNKTLASGRVFNIDGERIPIRGYWGDIVTSPYISYGIECPDESFFKKTNGVYSKTSEDVSVFNITSYLYAIQYKKAYTKEPDISELVIKEIDEDKEQKSAENSSLDLSNIKINFLSMPHSSSTGDIIGHDIFKKEKFRNLFKGIFVGSSLAHLVSDQLTNTLTTNSFVIIESAKYLIELNKEDEKLLNNKIIDLAMNAGGKKLFDMDDIGKLSMFKFAFNSNNL